MTDSSVAETYAGLADGMATVIASVFPQQWDAASACEGWSARDVLAHLIDTQREFFERHGFALPPRPDPADPVTAWSTHTATIREILADPQVPARAFDGHFGPTTIGETLLRFYGFDLIAHRWDIAAATDSRYRFTDGELDRLEEGIAAFGDALRMEGVCGPAVEVGPDADRQTRVLAVLGRHA